MSSTPEQVESRAEDGDPTEASIPVVGGASRWWGVAAWSAYVLVAFLVLYPALATPVIADDFVNPFEQVNTRGASLADAWTFGWSASVDGGSFRLAGTLSGAVVSWLTVWLSATFDVPIATIWGGVKLTMALLSAVSIAWFWRSVRRLCGATAIGTFESVAVVSAVLFTTLQIHAAWSNDPVASYPLVGFGSVALCFAFMALVVRAVQRPSIGSIVIVIASGVLLVGYYEMNVAAIIGVVPILVAWTFGCAGSTSSRWRLALASVAMTAIPLAVVLFGRRVTAGNPGEYAGTSVRLGREAVETMTYGVLGSLPGAAWRQSVRALGGSIGIVPIVFGVMTLLLWPAWNYVANRAPRGVRRVGSARRVLTAAVASGLVAFWFVAVAIHAVTVKVQDETLGLGYVYTSYAVGAAVVALGLAAAAHGIITRGATHWWMMLATCAVVTFAFVQLTVNWRLSEQLNTSFGPNRRLLQVFDVDVAVPLRCQALEQWTLGPWPEYYEVGMIGGLQQAFEYYFDEPFCDGFVRPP